MRREEYIRAALPTTELLAGLAEEAAELAQAALKYRRALDKTNPTPTTAEDAEAALCEEIADVLLYLFTIDPEGKICETMEEKAVRWVARLKGEA